MEHIQPQTRAMTTPTEPVEFERRIEALELKLMDLENTVQELNGVILAQYRDIETLHTAQQHLVARLSGDTNRAATPSATDELPPHY